VIIAIVLCFLNRGLKDFPGDCKYKIIPSKDRIFRHGYLQSVFCDASHRMLFNKGNSVTNKLREFLKTQINIHTNIS
jgi:hypothetical protein